MKITKNGLLSSRVWSVLSSALRRLTGCDSCARRRQRIESFLRNLTREQEQRRR